MLRCPRRMACNCLQCAVCRSMTKMCNHLIHRHMMPCMTLHHHCARHAVSASSKVFSSTCIHKDVRRIRTKHWYDDVLHHFMIHEDTTTHHLAKSPLSDSLPATADLREKHQMTCPIRWHTISMEHCTPTLDTCMRCKHSAPMSAHRSLPERVPCS